MRQSTETRPRVRGAEGGTTTRLEPASASPVTLRLVLRYVAFQLPELAIVGCVLAIGHEWGALSGPTAYLLFGLWILKEVVMFPLTRAAYAPGDGRSPRDLLGALGVAHEGLEGDAYVRVGPELWRARRAPGCRPLPPGKLIRVVALEGLTVLVEEHLDEAER